ncbi:MAG: helix-turn-helix domain-containing protein [Chloroflexota bacterium]
MSERSLPDGGESFGRVLAGLRKSRGISQTGLADRVKISPEHLCRIERGDKAPPRRATVDRLSSALGLEAEERSRLMLAAGYDASLPWISLDPSTRDALHRFWSESAKGLGPSRALPLPLSPLSMDTLHTMPASIRGVEAVLQAMVALLRVAAGTPLRGDRRILFTSSGMADLLHKAPELRLLLTSSIRSVLQSGWNICHLWRLRGGDDPRRSVEFVTDLLQYLGFPGRYEPYSLRHEESLSWAPADFVLVPGVGTLLLLPTSQEAHPDSALLLLDPGSLELLARHFDLLQGRSKPLLTVYPSNRVEGRAFDEALTLADEMEGDRFLMKDGPNAVLIPHTIWSRRIERFDDVLEAPLHRGFRQSAAQLLANMIRRQSAFDAQLASGRWRLRDICTRSAILRLVRDGELPRDDILVDGPAWAPLALEERRDVLNELLRRLEHPKYEMALLHRADEELARSNWFVKGGHAVFLESWCPTGEGQEAVNVGITEPAVVRAFHTWFLEIWQGLGRQSWDKRTVRQWLSRQIEELQSRIDVEKG